MKAMSGLLLSPLSLLLVAVLVGGQAAAQSTADHDAVLARIRKAALGYADSLQDFICTQLMTRSTDASGTGKHWKILEKQELDLGYIDHREHYKLLKVNGQTTRLEDRVKRGYFRSSGEFGSILLDMFSPRAAAGFAWDRESSSGGRRLCTFRYHVS